MSWKNWPGWLKGGIIAEVVLVVTVILAGFIMLIGGNQLEDGGFIIPLIILLPTSLFLFLFSLIFGTMTDNFFVKILGYLFVVISYFIVGAIIGWLAGKIKSRVKNE